jgi:hypothetical protein
MRSPLALVTAGVFLHFTCWKLMTPLLPLWAGRFGATPELEPEPGVFNTAYLASIEQTVQTLANNGICILDFHQDAYGSAFGGEGAPAWAVQTDGVPNPQLPFPLNEFFDPAENQAWDAFWSNADAPNGEIDLGSLGCLPSVTGIVDNAEAYADAQGIPLVARQARGKSGLTKLRCIHVAPAGPLPLAHTRTHSTVLASSVWRSPKARVRSPPWMTHSGSSPLIESASHGSERSGRRSLRSEASG